MLKKSVFLCRKELGMFPSISWLFNGPWTGYYVNSNHNSYNTDIKLWLTGTRKFQEFQILKLIEVYGKIIILRFLFMGKLFPLQIFSNVNGVILKMCVCYTFLCKNFSSVVFLNRSLLYVSLLKSVLTYFMLLIVKSFFW